MEENSVLDTAPETLSIINRDDSLITLVRVYSPESGKVVRVFAQRSAVIVAAVIMPVSLATI